MEWSWLRLLQGFALPTILHRNHLRLSSDHATHRLRTMRRGATQISAQCRTEFIPLNNASNQSPYQRGEPVPPFMALQAPRSRREVRGRREPRIERILRIVAERISKARRCPSLTPRVVMGGRFAFPLSSSLRVYFYLSQNSSTLFPSIPIHGQKEIFNGIDREPASNPR